MVHMVIVLHVIHSSRVTLVEYWGFMVKVDGPLIHLVYLWLLVRAENFVLSLFSKTLFCILFGYWWKPYAINFFEIRVLRGYHHFLYLSFSSGNGYWRKEYNLISCGSWCIQQQPHLLSLMPSFVHIPYLLDPCHIAKRKHIKWGLKCGCYPERNCKLHPKVNNNCFWAQKFHVLPDLGEWVTCFSKNFYHLRQWG